MSVSVWELILGKGLENSSQRKETSVVIVGFKSSGKTTLANILLNKDGRPKPTFGIDYTFGKRHHKDGNTDVCHILEVGNFSTDLLRTALTLACKRTENRVAVVVAVDLADTDCFSYPKELISVIPGHNVSLAIVGTKSASLKDLAESRRLKLADAFRLLGSTFGSHIILFDRKDAAGLKQAKELLNFLAFGGDLRPTENSEITRLFVPRTKQQNLVVTEEVWRRIEEDLGITIATPKDVSLKEDIISDSKYKESQIDVLYAQRRRHSSFMDETTPTLWVTEN